MLIEYVLSFVPGIFWPPKWKQGSAIYDPCRCNPLGLYAGEDLYSLFGYCNPAWKAVMSDTFDKLTVSTEFITNHACGESV